MHKRMMSMKRNSRKKMLCFSLWQRKRKSRNCIYYDYLYVNCSISAYDVDMEMANLLIMLPGFINGLAK